MMACMTIVLYQEELVLFEGDEESYHGSGQEKVVGEM